MAAPTRTFTNLLPEPFVDGTGRLSSWGGQFLLRLTGYVGTPPAAGAPGFGLTVTENMQTLLEAAAAIGVPLLPGFVPPQGSAGARALPALPSGGPGALRAPAPPLLPFPTSIIILANGARLIDGFLGTTTQGPNGLVPGNIGDIFLQRDGSLATGAVWLKLNGAAGTNTGWFSAIPDSDLGATATGSTQADAYPIVRAKTTFTNVAPGTGFVLPAAIPGDTRRILNRGANLLTGYPAVGQFLESNAVNIPLTVPVGGAITFDGETTSLWFAS
jgi:hypothetical protein